MGLLLAVAVGSGLITGFVVPIAKIVRPFAISYWSRLKALEMRG